MADKLNNDPDLCAKLIPNWELGCRRITPGSGYLESFLRPNVHLIQSSIKEVTEDSVVTEDGQSTKLDVCKYPARREHPLPALDIQHLTPSTQHPAPTVQYPSSSVQHLSPSCYLLSAHTSTTQHPAPSTHPAPTRLLLPVLQANQSQSSNLRHRLRRIPLPTLPRHRP